MNLARLKMLEEFALQEPGEPFNIYALALEYQSVDTTKAKELFERVLHEHPTYVPAYYPAGNLFWETGDETRALIILRTGLEKARAAGEKKAAGEIQSLLDAFE